MDPSDSDDKNEKEQSFQKQEKPQNDEQILESLDEQERVLSESPQYSEYSSSYMDFMGSYEQKISQNGSQKQTMAGKSIRWMTIFQPELKFSLINSNTQCTLVEAYWGHVCLQISIYRIKLQSKDVHENKPLGKGTFSKVYDLKFEDKNYVIKSIQLNPKSFKQELDPSSDLNFILSEYFMSKVASQLGVGPQLVNLFGFDLIVYNDCADFIMQYCQKVTPFEVDLKQMMSDLRQSLKIMHSIHFCHCDIKPDNILWNPRTQKYTFIDFGVSLIVKEPIGKRTLTPFLGTFIFCGAEMKKIFWLKEKRFIDLYFNDVESLQASIEYLKQQIKKIDVNKIQQEKEEEIQELNIDEKQANECEIIAGFFQIKHFIFTQKYQQAFQKIKKQTKMFASVRKIFMEEFVINRIQNQIILSYISVQQFNKVQQFFQEHQQIFFHQIDEKVYKQISKVYQQSEQILLGEQIFQQFNFNNLNEHFIDKIWRNRRYLSKILLFLNSLWKQYEERIQIQKNKLKCVLIEMIFNIKIKPEIKVSQNPSFLLKTYFVLQELLQFSLQVQSIKNLYILRELFIQINDYGTVRKIQNIIVKNLSEDSSWFFVLRVSFYIKKYAHFSTQIFYPDYQWLKQVEERKIDNDELIEQLKMMSILILSSGINQQGIQKYLKVQEILFKMQQKKISNNLSNKLQHELKIIYNFCLLIKKRFLYTQNSSDKKFQLPFQAYHTRLHINDFRRFQLSKIETYEKSFNGGFIKLFSTIKKYISKKQLWEQFHRIIIKHKEIMICQIEYILQEISLSNLQMKLYFLRVFLQNFDPSKEQMSKMRSTQILIMFSQILCPAIQLQYHEPTFFAVNFDEQYKKSFVSFYQKLEKVMEQQNIKDEIVSFYVVIGKTLQHYSKSSLNDCIKYFLEQCLDILNKQPKKQDRFVFHEFTRQARQIYKVLSYRQNNINQILVTLFDKSTFKLEDLDLQVIIMTLQTVVQVKLELQDPVSIFKQIFRIVESSTFYDLKYKNLPTTAPTIFSIEYILSSSAKLISKKCSTQEISQIIDVYKQKKLIDFSVNQFLMIPLIQVMKQCPQTRQWFKRRDFILIFYQLKQIKNFIVLESYQQFYSSLYIKINASISFKKQMILRKMLLKNIDNDSLTLVKMAKMKFGMSFNQRINPSTWQNIKYRYELKLDKLVLNCNQS